MKTLKLFTLAVMAVSTLAACNDGGKNKDGNPMAAESPSGDPAVKTDTGSESCGDTCHNSCTELSEASLAGSWEQPVPGMDGRQGMKLDPGGTASSINMATLVIDKWSLAGDTLILSGKSIGNGRTIDFTVRLFFVTQKQNKKRTFPEALLLGDYKIQLSAFSMPPGFREAACTARNDTLTIINKNIPTAV